MINSVVLGATHKTAVPLVNLVRPPCEQAEACAAKGRCHHRRMDSVLFDDPQYRFREFVVYDNVQCYPEYHIRYTRQK